MVRVMGGKALAFLGGTPSPSHGYLGRKILAFNGLQPVGVCKIFIIKQLRAKYFLSMS
jgi:hypothetical protein